MTEFDTFFEKFKKSHAWKQMTETVEASPWHREANVAVHTQMTLDQYAKRFEPIRSAEQNKIAKFALLFHDVGKPAAEEVLEKKDGSGDKYRRYAGHEQDSSVAFMEEYVRNTDLRAALTPVQARQVRWIIEHHLPYGLKQADKVNGLRTAIWQTLGNDQETFFDCLRSDSAGRISDDHEQKLANVEEWIKAFKAVQVMPMLVDRDQNFGKHTMYILIGPSGSGKSTWTAKHQKPGDIILSLDTMRLEFVEVIGENRSYKDEAERYAHAWEVATAKEAAFSNYIIRRTKELMASCTGNVFIDNVNASRKRRAQWVQLGRANDCKIVAVEFWNTLDVLAARQKTRGDKSVPYNAVKQQQYSVTCAWYGDECDEVVIVVGEPK